MTTSVRVVALAAISLWLVTDASADPQTWDNGEANSTWDTSSTNWSGVAWTNGNNAVFGVAGAGTITVSGSLSVSNLTVSGAPYTFTNGTLNFPNISPINLIRANLWPISTNVTINSDLNLTFGYGQSMAIGAEGGKTTLAGNVTINPPVLGGSGVIDTTNGHTLEIAGNVTYTTATTGRLRWGLGGSNAAIVMTSGKLVIPGNTTSQGLSGAGNATFTLNGGSVTVGKFILGNGDSANFTMNGGTLTNTDGSGIILGQGGSGAGKGFNFNLNGGTIVARRFYLPTSYIGTVNAIRLNGGIFRVDNISSSGLSLVHDEAIAYHNIQVLVGSGGAIFDTAGVTTYPAIFGEVNLLEDPDNTGGKFIKLGGGTLQINTTASYTGVTTVSNGTLRINGTIDTSPVTVKSGAELGGSGTLGGAVTVESDGTLAPSGGVFLTPGNYTSTLTVNNDVTLQSGAQAVFGLNTTNAPATNDSLVVSGTLSVTGSTLTVTNLGPALSVGDSFTLCSQATSGFTTVNLPAGYTWTNKLALDGSIQVLTVGASIPTTPTNISYTVSGGAMTINWPAEYLGWILQEQTNGITSSGTWFDVPGTAGVTSTNLPINPAYPEVFFRLRLP